MTLLLHLHPAVGAGLLKSQSITHSTIRLAIEMSLDLHNYHHKIHLDQAPDLLSLETYQLLVKSAGKLQFYISFL